MVGGEWMVHSRFANRQCQGGRPASGRKRQVSQVAILYPVFGQVLLTVAVYVLLLAARARAVRASSGLRSGGDLAMGRFPWPEDAEKRGHNQRNQFELPVLFYAVSAFALIVNAVDVTMLALAWAFVASRILHAAIHIGSNRIRWRGPAFILGFLIVTAMWVKLFLHVALGST
jgi:hypothetical protein